jgi:hypothetical protein
MNDIVEAAGEGIDPLSEACAYAAEGTSSPFRSKSTKLMHAMYGAISKGLHSKIYGSVERGDVVAAIGKFEKAERDIQYTVIGNYHGCKRSCMARSACIQGGCLGVEGGLSGSVVLLFW